MSARRPLLALVALLASVVLSACGSGFNAETNRAYNAAEGSNHRAGDVMVLNALFVDNENGTATFSATFLNTIGSPLTLSGVNGTTMSGQPLDISLAGPVSLADGVMYASGMQSADIVLNGGFEVGRFVNIVLSFSNADDVELELPIVMRTAVFQDVQTAGGPADEEGQAVGASAAEQDTEPADSDEGDAAR